MTIKNICIAFLAVVALTFCASAQINTLSSTTLSAAIDNKQLTFTLGSTTGMGAYPNLQQAQGGIGSPTGATLTELFVDKEAMEVLVIPTSGTVTVKLRGDHGTQARAHASGAKVYFGIPAYFGTFEPSGSCTASTLLVLPVVIETTGRIFDCANSLWTVLDGTSNVVGSALASAATIAPLAPVTHVTGTTTVNTITVPRACPWTGCSITLIPDGLWSTGTSGNVAIATTGVVSKALILTYDPGTSKWYPSY